MRTLSRSCIIRFVAVSIGSAALVVALTQPHAAEQHHKVVPADAITWGPAPPSLPPGAQAAVLLGSPAKEGPFVLRLKFPAGFVVPPHRHSKDELVTVLAGSFAIGMGMGPDGCEDSPDPKGIFPLHLSLPASM